MLWSSNCTRWQSVGKGVANQSSPSRFGRVACSASSLVMLESFWHKCSLTMGTLLQSLLICCKCSVAVGWTKPPQHNSSSGKLLANKSFHALQQNPKLGPQRKTTRIILLILLPTFAAWKNRCDKSFMHYNKTQNWVLQKRTTRNNLLILLLTFAAWENRCDENTKRESLNLLTVELINGTGITTS